MTAPVAEPPTASITVSARPVKWGKVIDHTRCIGCHACTTACKSENDVPLSVTRTYVKYVETGRFPHARRAFQVTRCNQCDHAPCTTACPTTAMYRRRDGIVDFDKSICIGCKACIAACPYDAIFINPEDHAAEKCNVCAHRLDVGLEPACVIVCPTEAILVGDLNDPGSRVAQVVAGEPVAVRRPDKHTAPKLFYAGVTAATLDPIAARRPGAGLFMWSEQGRFAQQVTSGRPDGWRPSSAEALLSYDVPHSAPWGWAVSVYTWTKAIAAGAYLVPLLALWGGVLPARSPLWLWVAPLLAAIFLAATGALLIADLKHPERFYLIFTRPQWSSWLVRGAFIIAAYGAVLALHLGAALRGATALQAALTVAGAPLAVLTAVYTAYLFAQAKGRDFWQSPLLPGHFLLQAVLAGTASLLPLAALLAPGLTAPLLWTLGASLLLQLGFVWAEAALGHSTDHAQLAAHEMLSGRYRAITRLGLTLTVAALAACVAALSTEGPAGAPWIGAAAAAFALGGLLACEHAYVQAGQAVPLA